MIELTYQDKKDTSWYKNPDDERMIAGSLEIVGGSSQGQTTTWVGQAK